MLTLEEQIAAAEAEWLNAATGGAPNETVRQLRLKLEKLRGSPVAPEERETALAGNVDAARGVSAEQPVAPAAPAQVKAANAAPKVAVEADSWAAIGARLRRAREARGMSRPAVAKALGVKTGTVCDAEYGRGRQLIERIGELLKISREWLMTGEGEMEIKAEAKPSEYQCLYCGSARTSSSFAEDGHRVDCADCGEYYFPAVAHALEVANWKASFKGSQESVAICNADRAALHEDIEKLQKHAEELESGKNELASQLQAALENRNELAAELNRIKEVGGQSAKPWLPSAEEVARDAADEASGLSGVVRACEGLSRAAEALREAHREFREQLARLNKLTAEMKEVADV